MSARGVARVQESFRELYRLGELDDRKVMVDIPGARVNITNMDGPGGQALQEMISRLDRRVPDWTAPLCMLVLAGELRRRAGILLTECMIPCAPWAGPVSSHINAGPEGS
jgi:hypothetical protein